ncbi:WecB/TagA/CpsF family glycosyltransferase [Okibacterium endophyticum]
MTTTDPDRGIVVGVPVDAVTMDAAVQTIIGWTFDDAAPRVAIGVNAHVCNLAATDPRFRAILSRADLAYADGQSVVWASKLLKTPVPERLATTDLVFPLMAACEKEGKSVFLFGGRPGIPELAAERLTEIHPSLRIATHHGYVQHDQVPDLLAAIADHRTDVLLVGLGDPLQQEWIAEHRHEVSASAILSCGGLFDWTSGANRRAPAWMIRAGLEWLWRLLIEPRRLAKRYLIGNPAFIARLGMQYLRMSRQAR